jgi:hypothetical protein
MASHLDNDVILAEYFRTAGEACAVRWILIIRKTSVRPAECSINIFIPAFCNASQA